MHSKQILLRIIFFLLLALMTPSKMVAADQKIPLRHPSPKNEDLRTCTICHEPEGRFPFERYNHTLLFGEKHGGAARANLSVCRMCHSSSDCSTCHGAGIGLAPGTRNHADPRAGSPHRGNYLARHRIDGRLNPTTCFHCHGTPKTSRSCRSCHR
jgi:hypothetical protein